MKQLIKKINLLETRYGVYINQPESNEYNFQEGVSLPYYVTGNTNIALLFRQSVDFEESKCFNATPEELEIVITKVLNQLELLDEQIESNEFFEQYKYLSYYSFIMFDAFLYSKYAKFCDGEFVNLSKNVNEFLLEYIPVIKERNLSDHGVFFLDDEHFKIKKNSKLKMVSDFDFKINNEGLVTFKFSKTRVVNELFDAINRT